VETHAGQQPTPVGVAVAVGFAVAVAVAVGFAVGVAVGLTVAVAVAVAVGLTVAVAVAVGVGVAPAVQVPCRVHNDATDAGSQSVCEVWACRHLYSLPFSVTS
jgi:hypothetical protein